MIENIVTEGKKVSTPEMIIGNEKFVWILMNWFINGLPLLNPKYISACQKANSLGIPIGTISIINTSNSASVDYKTPENDKQINWIKNQISVYSSSIILAFGNYTGTETPQNFGDKLQFFHDSLNSILGIPVVMWISDTNMDAYPGENLASGLRGKVLAMFYDKPENQSSAKPPAPTDYGAKNVFYVYDNRVVSKYSESACAGYLGVSSLGGMVSDTPSDEPSDPGGQLDSTGIVQALDRINATLREIARLD